MDSHEFMVFSIDEPIQCIQQFEQGLMFISTAKRIMLYDLCESKVIAQCQHQTNQKQQSQQSAIEMHYFPINKQKENQIQRLKNQQKKYALGYILVHYKMKGLSIYTFSQLQNNQNQYYVNDHTSNNQYQLQFSNFTHVMFGSAFLKLSFDNSIFKQQVKTEQQAKQNKQFLQSIAWKDMNNTQIQRTIKDIKSFQDFQLERQKEKCNTFYVFTNENELYEVKKFQILNGKLQMLQTYQIDEQTAQLSLSTVTQMKVISYVYDQNSQSQNREQKQLILAMQGGNMYIYQLPISSTKNYSNNNIQHYLQPTTTLYLQQHIKSKIIKEQDLDCSILCIEMIADGLGLVIVRKLGIWLVDFRNYKILSKIQPKSNKRQQVNKNKQKSKIKKYCFNDVKMIKSTHSLISQHSQYGNNPNQKQTFNTTQLKKKFNISSTFILYTSNKLIKLNLTLSVIKQFDSDKSYTHQVQISKIKYSIIQEINTNMIQSLHLTGYLQKNEMSQKYKHTQKFSTNTIKFYGHFKQDKIFTSTI